MIFYQCQQPLFRCSLPKHLAHTIHLRLCFKLKTNRFSKSANHKTIIHHTVNNETYFTMLWTFGQRQRPFTFTVTIWTHACVVLATINFNLYVLIQDGHFTATFQSLLDISPYIFFFSFLFFCFIFFSFVNIIFQSWINVVKFNTLWSLI